MMDGTLEGYAAYEDWEARQPKLQVAEPGEKRIAFSRNAYRVAHFGLIASGTASAVLIFRMIPWLSFGSFAIRIIATAVVGKEALFGADDDRPGYQAAATAIALGSAAGEWDAILAIFGAVGDFLSLYGGSIVVGLLMVCVLVAWLWGGRNVST
ncbi:MAG: hypothetical protein JGK29_30715 [Microcoleus sp. PH2017_17_BER_D_A]|uniref:hypothetical protein n=2 Tax=Microcoleus TaxID=44471 RepID=UPI001DAFB68B|nr:hypothetical protein [Microcoleus sp. PH2017_18_LLB_O_A]MCC3513233.1 hypothetical protein [Microcoleus sp. PH2017_17_BER_D_A]MCC3515991.1 hypothetical protein [Microcoleus sp. PH2017_18_LLB_O_A]